MDASVNKMDKLRLVLLYAMRYETTPGSKIGEMKRLLRENGVSSYTVRLALSLSLSLSLPLPYFLLPPPSPPQGFSPLLSSSLQADIVDTIMKYGGASKRGGDLFGDKTTFGKFTTSLVRGLKGVSNVYTQHKPLLSGVLQQLLAGRLPESEFAFVGGAGGRASATSAPDAVVVFVLGECVM